MFFDEEDWKDSDQGRNLKDLLFDGQFPTQNTTPQQTATHPENRRKRKRKKKSSTVASNAIGKNEQISLRTSENPSPSNQDTSQTRVNKPRRKRNRKSNQTPTKFDELPQQIPSLPGTTKSKTTSQQLAVDNIAKMDWKRRKLSEMLGVIEPKKSSKGAIKLNQMQNQSKNDLKENAKISTNRKPIIQSSNNERSEALRNAVTTKLQSAQFRFINEQLYTRTSKDAKKLFSNNSKSFKAYHDGFTQQVAKWPVNPLDLIINFLKKRPSKWVVGDFGCGDATLAASVKNKVHSFDLVAVNDRVTVADISRVPLADCSLDVAIFCLSLMGTNYIEFITEANRTLRPRGLLKIAEVASRFTNVSKFVTMMKKLGFELDRQDQKNSHFIMLDFRKIKSPQSNVKISSELLKPCVYKKR